MEITRQQVIEAIIKESMIAGQWVESKLNGPCSVCAVGAVLRSKGIDNDAIPLHAMTVTKMIRLRDDASLPALLQEGLYMSALSVKWERLVDAITPSEWMYLSHRHLERLKPELLRWVLENFPDGVIYSDNI